jgi:uncharacterized cupredoxin-like copper-binding protein
MSVIPKAGAFPGKSGKRSRPLVACALLACALLLGVRDGRSEPMRDVGPGIDWSKSAVATVVMTEYRFDPERIDIRAGVPYRLRLENRGQEVHDFSAPEFFRNVSFKDPAALGTYGRSIVMKPGERRDVELIALKPGSYPLICADHDWAGMTGMIVVQ